MLTHSSVTRTLPLASLALSVVVLAPAAHALDLAIPGFVCDVTQQVCYDGQGPSLPQTRRSYGEKAERNLLARLSGRPPVQTFLLSNGAACDVRARTCWDDGNWRRNISHRLTQHLYGGGGGAVGGRTCQLMQRGRTLFNGSCSLNRRAMPNGSAAYVVETQDGRRYSFYNEGYGRLILRDATGAWPVTYSNYGQQVMFRWADVQLTASRSSVWGAPGAPSGYGSATPDPRTMTPQTDVTNPAVPASPGQALDSLLNSLFR